LQIETLIRNFNRKWINFVLVPAFFAALACGGTDQKGGSVGGGRRPPERSPNQTNHQPSPEEKSPPRSDVIQGLPDKPLAPIALDVPGNARFKITDYGEKLRSNKRSLLKALSEVGASAEETALIVAVAMQETTYMSTSEIDRSKDNTPAANISILNINYDMVQQLGYAESDFGVQLNDPNKLGTAASFLLKGFKIWTAVRTLNFHRGGRTAFKDGVSFGAVEYRNSIATIYAQIAKDPTLLEDGRRIEVDVPHV
jgi:hypothetical protein